MPINRGRILGIDASVSFVAIEAIIPIANNPKVKKIPVREIGLSRDSITPPRYLGTNWLSFITEMPQR
jgi:hypothetical protein